MLHEDISNNAIINCTDTYPSVAISYCLLAKDSIASILSLRMVSITTPNSYRQNFHLAVHRTVQLISSYDRI